MVRYNTMSTNLSQLQYDTLTQQHLFTLWKPKAVGLHLFVIIDVHYLRFGKQSSSTNVLAHVSYSLKAVIFILLLSKLRLKEMLCQKQLSTKTKRKGTSTEK